MAIALPTDLPTDRITVSRWDDPVIDALGYATRSTYVERFWLAVLGPSSTWLIRYVDQQLDRSTQPAVLDLDEVAGTLGLGAGRGRHSPVVRSMQRCCQFGLARAGIDTHLTFRRHLPPLTRHQVERLPGHLKQAHHEWREVERDAGLLDSQGRRARHMAMGLAELGEDVPTIEHRLMRHSIHPVVAEDAARWAHRLVTHIKAEHAREAGTDRPAPASAALTASSNAPAPAARDPRPASLATMPLDAA